MSTIQVNGQSVVPPGFRFHPTEEELLSYYLRKKVSSQKIDLEVIRDVDLNKLEPWDIQEKCRIGSSTPQSDWYFFSHKDKKYPTGTRTNRATAAGFWKATGRDKLIYSAARRIGMRKTLVFYKGRAPHGQKSDWIMHEYRLDDHPQDLIHIGGAMGETTTNRAISDHNQDEGWVVCRVFKKKNLHHHHHKPSVDAGGNNSSSATSRLDGGGALDQILQFMGTRSCKWERGASCSTRNGGVDDRRPRETAGGGLLEMFMKLPALESPNINYNPYCSFAPVDGSCSMKAVEEEEEAITGDWTAFDRLLASQLDGSTNGAGEAGCFGFEIDSSAGCRALVMEENEEDDAYRPRGDGDLWSLTRTTSAISDNTSRASR